MIEEIDYIEIVKDDELIIEARSGQFQNGGLILDNIEELILTDEPLSACWSVKVFKVCVRKIEINKVILDLYLADSRLGTATLTPQNACVKVKKSIGGDAARVDTKICADFTKKEVRTEGRVCASFVCVKFNARVVKW
jgi:hypothetical protein